MHFHAPGKILLEVLVLIFAAPAVTSFAAEKNAERISIAMRRPPPDFERAVKEEYARLKAKGTREALELFIARHPTHPLAEKAREDLRHLDR